MAQGIKIKAEIEAEKMYKAIQKMNRLMPEKQEEVLKESAEFFVRSAQKSTPPAIGKKNVPLKMQKRPVIKLTDPRYPASRKRTKYKVPFRNNRKKGVKYFNKQKEARSFSRILFSGASRAGWWGALLRLRRPLEGIKTNAKTMSIARKFARVLKQNFGTNKPSLIVENDFPEIQKYAIYSKTFGMGRAANRMNYLARKRKKEMEVQTNVGLN